MFHFHKLLVSQSDVFHRKRVILCSDEIFPIQMFHGFDSLNVYLKVPFDIHLKISFVGDMIP